MKFALILQLILYIQNVKTVIISKKVCSLKLYNRFQKVALPSSNINIFRFELQSVTDQTADSTDHHSRVPSYSELLKFALPTLGIWLLQPILSLIDTSVVGINKLSTVAQLAALGPGVAWIDSTSYLFQFMGIATTSLYVNALNSKTGSESKSAEVLSHSLFTSLLFGIFLLAIQFIFSPVVITLLCGKAKESIPYGILYARYRAFAAPFALPTIVAQAAFLAVKDAVTPLKAVLVGAAVNVIGDLLCVSVLNMGVRGAAIATTVSQAFGTLYLLYVALRNLSRANKSPLISWKVLKQYVFIPDFKAIMKYLAFCGPLFLILLAKTVLWTYTTFACSTAGAVELAAHQISINFFLFFCIFGDVISQISQTYLPYFLADMIPTLPTLPMTTPSESEISSLSSSDDLIASNNAPTNALPTVISSSIESVDTSISSSSSSLSITANSKRAASIEGFKATISKACTLGAFLGVANCAVCVFLDRFAYGFITSSLEVRRTLSSVSPLLMLSVLPHCLMLALEGVTIAIRDTQFHLWLYLNSAILFIAYQTHVRSAVLGARGVWIGLVGFQWLRLFLFAIRNYFVLQQPQYKT